MKPDKDEYECMPFILSSAKWEGIINGGENKENKRGVIRWQDRKKDFDGYCQHCNEMTPMAWRYDKPTSNADSRWYQCLKCGKIELHSFRRHI
jgi:hypothetical protein